MKLLKMLTYFKRKKRIEDKIWQRVMRRYPKFPIYDRCTGKKRFDTPELKIKICKNYDASTGKSKYYFNYYTLKIESDTCYRRWNLNKPLYKFDKNGKIIYKVENSEYEIYLTK